MRLVAQALQKFGAQPRLTDARFTGQQHHLALAALGARPSALQQVELFRASDQRRHPTCVQRLEATLDRARALHLPYRYRCTDALQLDRAKLAILEEAT